MQITEKIKSLVSEGKADRVFGWKKGELGFDTEPALFTENFDSVVYNGLCGANLCKYMINETKKDGKVLLLLKPCDSRGLQLLTKEHRVRRERIYALGVPCRGKIDADKISAQGIKGITDIQENGDTLTVVTLYGEHTVPRQEVLYEKCLSCAGKEHVGCDEVLMPELSQDTTVNGRFAGVTALEEKSAEERFAFWRSQLSKCIRCNACRNVCPACSCVKCVFDNPSSGMDSKANADDFEENLYHIIRSFHVCGRCTDCGECSRVCPEKIPLHLLNRKYIKDIHELYGDEDEAALLTFTKDDAEPSVVCERGEGHA